MRTEEKIKKNIISSIQYQVLTLLLGFLIPRLVLISLGSEANGLINSTNQVITYLALFEGGMGLSITQSLYGPVAKKEYDTINGIMSASNIFYRNVGTYYFAGLLVIGVIYSITIQSTYSPMGIFAVVILTGIPQVINFFFQGKYRTLISVSGKSYVLTNLNSVVYIGTSVSKIVLLLSGFGIIALQAMYCVVSLIQMIFIIWYVKKEFPWLDISVAPAKEKIGQRSSVFLHQISGFVFSNTDMIVLTYFCSLKIVSVYSMYSMFFSLISGMISTFTSSIMFAMGQKFNSDREGFLKIQNSFETWNMVLVFSCNSVLCLCILPFLRLYTSGVVDINYIDPVLPFLFTAIQLLQAGRLSSQKVIEYAGEFRRTQWHAVLETIINLVVSIVAVIHFGIYGVLMGTIAALIFRSIAMIYYSCKKILLIKQYTVYKKWLINLVLFVGFQVAIRRIRIQLSSYIQIILYAGVLMLAALMLFGGAACCYDRESSTEIFTQLKKRSRK